MLGRKTELEGEEDIVEIKKQVQEGIVTSGVTLYVHCCGLFGIEVLARSGEVWNWSRASRSQTRHIL
jgi:hypothetical protein